jgi:hypothetical protein
MMPRPCRGIITTITGGTTIIKPSLEDVGRKVIYRDKKEVGVITALTLEYIFVRYGSQQYSKATKREDLDWFGSADTPGLPPWMVPVPYEDLTQVSIMLNPCTSKEEQATIVINAANYAAAGRVFKWLMGQVILAGKEVP